MHAVKLRYLSDCEYVWYYGVCACACNVTVWDVNTQTHKKLLTCFSWSPLTGRKSACMRVPPPQPPQQKSVSNGRGKFKHLTFPGLYRAGSHYVTHTERGRPGTRLNLTIDITIDNMYCNVLCSNAVRPTCCVSGHTLCSLYAMPQPLHLCPI